MTRLARITGALLIVMAISAMFAELGVRSTLVVPADAHATAERIQGSTELFRLGLVGYLVAFLCDVPVAVFFYTLLRPVHRAGALVAMAFRLVYAAVVASSLLFYDQALGYLGGEASLSALDPSQRQALALLSLHQFDRGFALALVFFGMHLAVLGTLLVQSRQLPRVIGALVIAGGAGYLANGFTLVLAPALHTTIAPVLAMLGMSELVLAVWLIATGLTPRPS